MNKYEFKTNKKVQEFCDLIINKMVELFGINKDEALGRLNNHWKGVDLTDDKDVVYHEHENYWANVIYYGDDSFWWKDPRPKDLKPLPYP